MSFSSVLIQYKPSSCVRTRDIDKPLIVGGYLKRRAGIQSQYNKLSPTVDQTFFSLKFSKPRESRKSIRVPPISCFDKQESSFSVGEEVELVCQEVAFGGNGVCRTGPTGFVVFCKQALPGEHLVARIDRVKKKYAEAYKLYTTKTHENATEAPCALFLRCGGCTFQNLTYEAQLQHKQSQVTEAVKRLGGVAFFDAASLVQPIVPAAQLYHYRNKVEFSYGVTSGEKEEEKKEVKKVEEEDGWPGYRRSALGLNCQGAYDKIIDVEECALQHQAANRALTAVRRFAPAGGQVAREADLSRVMIRTALVPNERGEVSVSAGDSLKVSIMVAFTSGRPGSVGLKSAAQKLAEEVKEVVSVLELSNTRGKARRGKKQGAPTETVLVGERTLRMHVPHHSSLTATTSTATATSTSHNGAVPVNSEGAEIPRESLKDSADSSEGKYYSDIKEEVSSEDGKEGACVAGLNFDVSARSFFQINTLQTPHLLQVVLESCQLEADKSDVVLDLFCGTGLLGLAVAPFCRSVVGVEIVEDAVRDAQHNARLNRLQNCTFLQGDLARVASTLGSSVPRPSVVIVDPARAGLDPSLVAFLLQTAAPRRIVYVSCNPTTQARDLRALCCVDSQIDSTKAGSSPAARYKLVSVTPVDMFPQTPHVETVALLERTSYDQELEV